jgi:CBS domain-containing protein
VAPNKRSYAPTEEGGSEMNVEAILAVKGDDVATVVPQASLADAAAALRDRGVGALVVSDDGRRLLGILSERDVVRALAAHGASALGRTVSSTMSADVVTCVAEDSVESLMAQMTERRIRHLPVVDAAGLLTGIVSIGDVVKSRLGQLESENQALHDYVHQGR